jgi:putative NADPH-quinone reductase
MRVLVLFAHPLPDSYQAALHARVLAGLAKAGHQVTDIDLYAEGFDPRLSAEERRDYHDLTRNTRLVEPYVRALREAEALVLVFPVWCFGLPAILKGFLDRVFVTGVSFALQDGKATPLLRHIRHLTAVTTYGRRWWEAAWMLDPPRMQITRYLRWFVHPRCRTRYFARYDMNRATEADRQAYLDRVGAHFDRYGG